MLMARWSDIEEVAFQAGAEAMRELAAYIAREACLVPPDGGAPTEDEREVCAEAARQIYAAKLLPQRPNGTIRQHIELIARTASKQFGVLWRDVQESERNEWRQAIATAIDAIEQPKIKMLVDNDWLKRNIPHDPEIDSDIGTEKPKLKCPGVGRDAANVCGIEFYFNRQVTDNEMRFLHEAMRHIAEQI